MPIDPPRALIVEDSPAWQEILSEILADQGLAVDVAAIWRTRRPRCAQCLTGWP